MNSLISIIPFVVFGLIVWFVVKWVKEKKPTIIDDKPMAWYKFYTYFRIPLGFLINLGQSLSLKEQFEYISPYIEIFGYTMLGALIFLFVGLHKRKLWAWKLNIVILIIEIFMYPLQIEFSYEYSLILYGIFVILLGFAWFWPNYTYFKKRIHLFK